MAHTGRPNPNPDPKQDRTPATPYPQEDVKDEGGRKVSRPAASAVPPKPSPAAAQQPVSTPTPAQTAPAPATAPVEAIAASGSDDRPGDAVHRSSGWLGGLSSAAVSMIIHIVVLVSLGVIVPQMPKKESPRIIRSAPVVEEAFEEFSEEPFDQPQVAEVSTDSFMPEVPVNVDVQITETPTDVDMTSISVELDDFGIQAAPASDMLQTVGAIGGQAGGLSGRTDPTMRKTLLQQGGGNEQSEKAVEAGLKWIITHQMPDGGWTFNLTQCPSCQGQCSHADTKDPRADRAGATAMALLPMLGRGYTHRTGPYQKQIEAGLTFLGASVVAGKGQAYPKGGTLYSQGIVGIVLSESYAMTQDPRLAGPSQLALNFIMNSQDPVGGGWRYAPRQPGDTSVVGWQLMALKSGHMAYLQVNPATILGAVKFLDSVAQDEGAQYGYATPGNGGGTSAVGLLCRMYLGWKKDHPALQRGVARLAKLGPSKDLYFDYYATQVLHHMEGDLWKNWNAKMRDTLIGAQAKTGHEAGSWYDKVDGGHGAHVGGRFYCTSLATMILEVYYRHLPIYGQGSVEDEFKE